MAINLYLMPATGAGTKADPNRGKYWDDLAAFSRAEMDYGLEPVFLVAADVDASTDTAMRAHADVTGVPQNLNGTVGAGAVTATKNALEAFNIPAGWVTAGITWKTVVRTTATIFQIAQRLHGLGAARLFSAGVTLDTQFNQLTAGQRQKLLDAADSFNFDRSGLTGAATMRVILKALADQWPAVEMPFGPGAL